MFAELGLSEHINSRIGDIRNRGLVHDILQEANPEIVIHMAAQALVHQSYDRPVETFMTNVMGTVNLLESARSARNLQAVVIVTSDKCYENREWTWGYRETDAMGGHDPYSASKGCAELVTASYRRSFADGMRIASARAGNVIGGGDWAENRLIPDIIRSLCACKPGEIRHPGAIRLRQHVLEPLFGYLLLAERLVSDGSAFAGAWNFGPNLVDTLPVSEIVRKISERLGIGNPWRLDEKQHPHEANYLRLDTSKAVGQLGYRPRVDLDTALDWTAEWYRAFLDHQEMANITHEQIDRFERLGASFRGSALMTGPGSNDALHTL
jgi:CDP-glucose 4,6-dehydratase